MARIKGRTLGTPSGKVGDKIYRNRGKKTLVYQLNEIYNKSYSDAALENESIFTEVTRFSNFVNKPAIVKNVWKFSKLPGIYSNLKIFKYNYKSIKMWGINSLIHILPANFFYESINISLDKHKLSLKFKVLPALIKYKNQTSDFNPPFEFLALIHAEGPIKKDAFPPKLNTFIIQRPDYFEKSLSGKSNFTFKTEKNSFPFFDDYNTIIVFPAIVSVESQNYKWAENGGFYIKGSQPAELLHKPRPQPDVPNSIFLTDY